MTDISAFSLAWLSVYNLTKKHSYFLYALAPECPLSDNGFGTGPFSGSVRFPAFLFPFYIKLYIIYKQLDAIF